MWRLSAFLAILTLLLSPVTAAAAQQACLDMGPGAMAGMEAPLAQSADLGAARSDPCCNEGQTQPDGHKACAQACASMCAVSAALPTANLAVPALPAAQIYALRVQPLYTQSPPRAERPPKLIA